MRQIFNRNCVRTNAHLCLQLLEFFITQWLVCNFAVVKYLCSCPTPTCSSRSASQKYDPEPLFRTFFEQHFFHRCKHLYLILLSSPLFNFFHHLAIDLRVLTIWAHRSVGRRGSGSRFRHLGLLSSSSCESIEICKGDASYVIPFVAVESHLLQTNVFQVYFPTIFKLFAWDPYSLNE